MKYVYGRIQKLADCLREAKISNVIINQIMKDGENVIRKTTPERKADWMREAMSRMDSLLDKKTRNSVREKCACCLGGKRREIVKGIAKNHVELKDRIKAANEAKNVFGHSVSLEKDGSIIVSFAPEGRSDYRCVCLPKAKEPISITYCYCCGGHVKSHLQEALGRKLSCTVKSSALSSKGQKPCQFSFKII